MIRRMLVCSVESALSFCFGLRLAPTALSRGAHLIHWRDCEHLDGRGDRLQKNAGHNAIEAEQHYVQITLLVPTEPGPTTLLAEVGFPRLGGLDARVALFSAKRRRLKLAGDRVRFAVDTKAEKTLSQVQNQFVTATMNRF